MKKIFIDCGSHYGEGFSEFKNILNINEEEWQCYLFEPNKLCYNFLINKYNNKNISIFNKAIYDQETKIIFRAEFAGDTKKHDGVCSTILDNQTYHFNYGSTEYEIETINLSNFINSIKEDSEIYCKMDIEGAEFSVLEKMIDDGTIKFIKKLYVEFHDWTMNPKVFFKEKKNKIIKYCNENNIELFLWK